MTFKKYLISFTNNSYEIMSALFHNIKKHKHKNLKTSAEIKFKNSSTINNVVLVGGGHAHVYILKKYARQTHHTFKLILISQFGKHYYSSMASAFLEGIYFEDDFSFDLLNMCKNAGIDFVEAVATRIDCTNMKLICQKSIEIPFDILSLDIGSEVAYKKIIGVTHFAMTVKPIINFFSIKKIIENATINNFAVIIVGAGAAGIETSLALRNYAVALGKNVNFSLIESGDTILQNYNSKIINKVIKILEKNEINLLLNETIVEVTERFVFTKKSKQINCDLLIWAVGTSANTIFLNSDIPTDPKGYMLVNNYLQSKDYPYIFGAGDCIGFENFKYVKKVGVYAIREAPVLWDNIIKYSRNKTLSEFRPQKTYLSIIATGSKTAILYYKGFTFSGKLAWTIKDIVDRGFMKRYKF